MNLALQVTSADLAAGVALAKSHALTAVDVTALPATPVDADIACLSTDLAMPAAKRRRAAQAERLRDLIDQAVTLNCRRVCLPDAEVVTHEVARLAVETGEWLLPLADHAADRDVTLLLQNRAAFRTARQMWLFLEAANHPAVAAAWDLDAGLAAGVSPAVLVPTLNSRLGLVRVRDASPPGAVELLLTRLRGVGYAGCLSIDAPADTLGETVARVRALAQPPAAPKGAKPVRA